MTNLPPPAPDGHPAPLPPREQPPVAPELAQPYPGAPHAGAPYPGAPQAGAPYTSAAYTDAPYTPAPAAPLPPVKQKKQRNVAGIIALIVSAIGFIFACTPGALALGWVLLPIGFILGIVALFLKGKPKWQGVTAIIVSIVGTVVGAIVFSVVVATAWDNAFNDSDVTVGDSPSATEAAEPTTEGSAPAADVGTRENPLPLGTPFSSEEWTVVINSVTFGPEVQAQILAANTFNEAPDAGTEFMLVNYTVTYNGTDAEGGMPVFVSVDYVTAAGVTVDTSDNRVVAPEALDRMSVLYEGASASGNTAIQVPTPADGVLAVGAGMLTDTIFVAIK